MDSIGSSVPLLVNLKPSGEFLMEDFFYAGGVPAVFRELLENGLLRDDALTANGHTIRDNVKDSPNYNEKVISRFSTPLKSNAGIVVLHGNLCPNGSVLKPSAASPHLMKHRGKVVVFESIEEFKRRIDDPELPVDERTVMVLKGAGPAGYPGMPEVGNMPLPPKLLARGITDLVRISDARMSGTAFGTVVLHVAPEAAVGGPLALVQEGDEIELDVERRSLNLLVSSLELSRRRSEWRPAPIPEIMKRGWANLYTKHVLQADRGADLDFLVGSSGAPVGRESH